MPTCQFSSAGTMAKCGIHGVRMLYAPTDPDQDPRHADTLEPLWNMFDLTPEGRPEGFEEQSQYPCCHR